MMIACKHGEQFLGREMHNTTPHGETHFLNVIEDFCLRYCNHFGDSSECRESSDAPIKEFPVAYQQIHGEFCIAVESVLEQFIA